MILWHVSNINLLLVWLYFYQTRSAWSVDQGTNKNHSPACNFTPTVTKFCVTWEGLSLPHDTEFGNCRWKIVDSRAFPSWSLIHGLRWSCLIAEPGSYQLCGSQSCLQTELTRIWRAIKQSQVRYFHEIFLDDLPFEDTYITSQRRTSLEIHCPTQKWCNVRSVTANVEHPATSQLFLWAMFHRSLNHNLDLDKIYFPSNFNNSGQFIDDMDSRGYNNWTKGTSNL